MEELGASEAHKTEILDYEVLKFLKGNSNFLPKIGCFGTIMYNYENLKIFTNKRSTKQSHNLSIFKFFYLHN